MRRKGVFFLVAVLLIAAAAQIENRVEQKQYESEFPKKARDEKTGVIRVLIKNNGFHDIKHEVLELYSESGLYIYSKEGKQEVLSSEYFVLSAENPLFKEGSIRIVSKDGKSEIKINSLQRGYGNPNYIGELEVFVCEDKLVIVNELPLETYLEAVVPSEMPESFELEALKAQAVCARSYAYKQMEQMAYPEYQAHVDDSTMFQVYGNSKKTEKTTRAVKETEGQVVSYEGEVAYTYFFSTSSGVTTEGGKTAYPYLQSVSVMNEMGDDYEENIAWYRWEASISKSALENLQLGKIEAMEIKEKAEGNLVTKLRIQGSEGTRIIEGEYAIRKCLGAFSLVTLQDGSRLENMSLLPSAFFTISEQETHYELKGGGYGHGIGMSQNGANEMAKAGKTYLEILDFFYAGTEVNEIRAILYGANKK